MFGLFRIVFMIIIIIWDVFISSPTGDKIDSWVAAKIDLRNKLWV